MRDRFKILMVVEATSAGVGRHVIDLASGFSSDLFDVTIAWSPARSDDAFRDAIGILKARGVHTVAIAMSRGLNPVTDLSALVALTRLIAREQFDLVHLHSSKAGFLGRIAARLARRSAVTVYTPNAISISLSRAYWYPEKAAAFLTDAIVAVSETERQELAGYGLVPDRKLIRVTAGIPIHTGELSSGTAIRESLGIPLDALLIGTVGRVSFQKDPQTFLQAAEETIRANPRAYFVWIGPGENLERMRAETVRRHLEKHVRFIGYRKDARLLIEAFDIFLLTSRYESFGYVTCEAMTLGKPVVASRVNGSSELVLDGTTGYLVPAGDTAAFAKALLRLIGDANLRSSLGSLGKERVERCFSLPRMVRETEQLYLRLIAARQSTAKTAAKAPRSAEAK